MRCVRPSTGLPLLGLLPATALSVGLLSLLMPSLHNAPASADTRRVHCHLNVESPVIKKTQVAANCQFSQYQGNAYVIMYPGNRAALEFEFPTAKQGVTYTRVNREGGIRFFTPVLTLKVFWADPGTSHSF